jgi:hypothetical protein
MYDRKHILLTWGGTLPGGEEWSCGVRLASAVSEASLSPIPLGIADDFLALLLSGSYSGSVKAFHTRSETGIHGSALLTHIKAAAIGTNGKYLPGQVAMVEEEFEPIPGGYGGLQHPNQCTVAVTTTTDLPRGLAHMGRFYLPMPGFTLDGDGVFSAADAANLAASASTFLENISDIPGVDIITSPGASVMSKVGSGASNRITGVKVGRVIDTQRRRRRDLPEEYVLDTVDQGTF